MQSRSPPACHVATAACFILWRLRGWTDYETPNWCLLPPATPEDSTLYSSPSGMFSHPFYPPLSNSTQLPDRFGINQSPHPRYIYPLKHTVHVSTYIHTRQNTFTLTQQHLLRTNKTANMCSITIHPYPRHHDRHITIHCDCTSHSRHYMSSCPRRTTTTTTTTNIFDIHYRRPCLRCGRFACRCRSYYTYDEWEGWMWDGERGWWDWDW